MSTSRSSLATSTRADVLPSRTVRGVIGVLVFAIATALSAKISLPLPGTPIPFTFQPLVVMLAGALLGARLGAASQIAYLAAGVSGLPVFAAGGGAAYLLGPTGGYLMAYPLAAFLVGALTGAGLLRTIGGLLVGLATIYAGGLAWLTATGSFDVAVVWGLRPFVLADMVKVVLAAVIIARLGDRSRDLFAR
ncbi:MAG: biotin transporter BioY [Gemmatimonadetes bacterium]|nr:biotin transporter BioY [Gemmatimonadota bacterium]